MTCLHAIPRVKVDLILGNGPIVWLDKPCVDYEGHEGVKEVESSDDEAILEIVLVVVLGAC